MQKKINLIKTHFRFCYLLSGNDFTKTYNRHVTTTTSTNNRLQERPAIDFERIDGEKLVEKQLFKLRLLAFTDRKLALAYFQVLTLFTKWESFIPLALLKCPSRDYWNGFF